jgi:ribosome biogenesis GTPase
MGTGGLNRLGFDAFFEKESSGFLQAGDSLARITEVNRNRFTVSDGYLERTAVLSGKYVFTAGDITDFPTVGDWVAIQAEPNHSQATVRALLPRKTLLKRKEAGKRVEFQLIAANIDYGLVVQTVDHLNPNLLDRYCVLLNESGIVPVIIINKTDLVSSAKIEAIKDSFSGFRGQVLFTSNELEGGTDAVAEMLIPGKTYCLLGQSGVGKSSLLNRLLGSSRLDVGSVRERDGKGRHTTVRRQLVALESGCLFIDTPGIRELGNFQVEDGLEATFDDVHALANQCRFNNCSHTHEKGCAVIDALNNGELEDSRYQNFLKLQKEAEFLESSYQEKRRKDKSFGKMLKQYKTLKRKNGRYQ